MATIQKVSGIDFADISKFDGVDISAVGSINFIGKPATGNLLLDTSYGSGAEAAYSVRKLRTAYTGSAILVQDTVGGATKAIGFDANGDLDTAELLAYAGSNDVLVATWYDQSGSGNNAEQISSGSRPKIVSSGAVIVENGKPAVEFDGSDDFFGDISKPSSTPAETMAIVLRLDVTTDQRMVAHPTPTLATGSGRFFVTSGNFAYNDYEANPTANTRALSAADTNQNLIFGEVDDTAKTAHIYKNGVAGTDGATLTKPLELLGYSETDIKLGSNRIATSSFFNGKMQEYIRWDIDRQSNRTDIEENIGDYFTQNTPLLDTYSGAAAAYSLRLLDSTYTGFAIKVQDIVGGATQDIGFNVFGELDTVSLLQYAGSNDVFVETWYDQSGSGNNAEQISSGKRPKIVSSGTVIVENGKPAILWPGNNYKLNIPAIGLTKQSVSAFIAVQGPSGNYDNVFGDVSGEFRLYNTNNGKTGFRYNQVHYGDIQRNNDYKIISMIAGSTLGGFRAYANNTPQFNLVSLSSGSISSLQVGTLASGSSWQGHMHELIFYPTDESDNRTGIESNINSFYGIYTPTPDPLLLNLYPGSAAAYSLRKLNANYTGSAVQIQRADNVGGTTDIGFDSYGDLDTTALTTAAAGNSMVVTTWFDQSGNSNDATQSTSANRPKIYDATTGVIVENGKPAVEFVSGAYKALKTSQNFTNSDTLTVYGVVEMQSAAWQAIAGLSTAINVRNEFKVSDGRQYNIIGTGSQLNGPLIALSQQTLTYGQLTSSGGELAINGNTATTGTGTTVQGVTNSSLAIGSRAHTSGESWTGTISELIMYFGTPPNRTGIETNINSFYGIY